MTILGLSVFRMQRRRVLFGRAGNDRAGEISGYSGKREGIKICETKSKDFVELNGK